MSVCFVLFFTSLEANGLAFLFSVVPCQTPFLSQNLFILLCLPTSCIHLFDFEPLHKLFFLLYQDPTGISTFHSPANIHLILESLLYANTIHNPGQTVGSREGLFHSYGTHYKGWFPNLAIVSLTIGASCCFLVIVLFLFSSSLFSVENHWAFSMLWNQWRWTSGNIFTLMPLFSENHLAINDLWP